jgi:hypothetical protein
MNIDVFNTWKISKNAFTNERYVSAYVYGAVTDCVE